MRTEQEINDVFMGLEKDVPGFIAASLVDLDSGMTLGAYSAVAGFDLGAASAYNSELVKQKLKIMQTLGLDTEMEDMMITLGDQIHIIQLVTPTTFVYFAAMRAGSNPAIVRSALARHIGGLR